MSVNSDSKQSNLSCVVHTICVCLNFSYCCSAAMSFRTRYDASGTRATNRHRSNAVVVT